MCTIGTTFKVKVGNKSKMNSDIIIFYFPKTLCKKNEKLYNISSIPLLEVLVGII